MRTRPKEILKRKIAAGLEDTSAYEGRQMAFAAIRPPTDAMRKKHAELASRVRGVKQAALRNSAELRRRAVEAMRANGFRVFEAADAAEARAYIVQVVGDGPLVKSKSNTAGEIELSEALAANGVETIETDLGDRLCQLGQTAHSHPLAPAIHLSEERAAELLSAEAGRTLPPDPEALVAAARETLRKEFFRARVGLSGANAVSADTGSIVLTENEGNIRSVTSLPGTHVVLAGWDKIVPSLEDALAVVRATAAYGGGTDIGTYVSVISGHPAAGTGDGCSPGEVHVVLLDNGRTRALEAGFGEALSCVNCGACLNHCPVYAEVGSAYGSSYYGGRGVVFSAFHSGLETAVESGLSLCLSCGRCVEVCPVEIDTPHLVARLRAEAARAGHAPFFKEKLLKPVLSGQRTRLAYEAGRVLQKIPYLPQRLSKRLSGREALPVLPPRPLERSSEPRAGASPPDARRDAGPPDAVFFPGCLNQFLYPEIGEAVLSSLRSAGVRAVLPPRPLCCSLPLIANGYVDEARAVAEENARLLHGTGAKQVVTACGSCGTAFKQEYPRLLPNTDPHVDWISRGTKDVSEILIERLGNTAGRGPDSAGRVPGSADRAPEDRAPEGSVPEEEATPGDAASITRVTYHDPCHLARGMGVRDEPRELLRRLPGVELVEMEEPDVCCGCAGTFSLEHYPLARRINERRLQQIQRTGAEVLVTGCAACISHFRDGLSAAGSPVRVVHTACVWDPDA